MAKSRKGGLGRGLGSIMNDPTVQKEVKEKVIARMIPVEQISPNRYQPRTDFSEKELDELKDSIKEHGIIQPLTVKRLEPAKYELISGERRLRASKLAGLDKVPAYIREANDEQMLEMALIENIQRQNLNPIEVAKSYSRLIKELQVSQEKVGDKVGKDRTSVNNYLRLLELPESVQKGLENGQISFGHGRVLAGIKAKEEQLAVFQEVIGNRLSVRQTESLAKGIKEGKEKQIAPAKKASGHDIQLRDVENQLVDKLGAKVKLSQDEKSGKGKMMIPFSNTEELNRLLEVLGII
jgi:ParB family chromosome partitioning protein